MTDTRLDIYVERGCMGCRRATELADWVRERFPRVRVRVMEPADDQSDQSALVHATPTYFLNGRQFSLGNPSEDELESALLPILEGNPRTS
jgi:hypothetical protein